MIATEQTHDWPSLIRTYLERRSCTRMALAQMIHATFDEIMAAERGAAPLPPGVDRRFLLAFEKAGLTLPSKVS